MSDVKVLSGLSATQLSFSRQGLERATWELTDYGFVTRFPPHHELELEAQRGRYLVPWRNWTHRGEEDWILLHIQSDVLL